MIYLTVHKSNKPNKRFLAVFIDKYTRKIKKVHFGSANGSTYIDHKDKTKREHYIKRHSKLDEDWDDPFSPGALSRHLLWGEHTNFFDAVNAYKKRFNLF